ncbi:MAG: hypothetical protein ACSLE8_18255 [Rhodococcus sp. (in: high G+C Gram-positive bacteria)]
MTEMLFSNNDLSSVLDATSQAAVAEVQSWDEDQLLAQSETEIVSYLMDKYSVRCPVLKTDEIEVDEPVDMQQQVQGYGRMILVPATRVVVHVPFDGDSEFFKMRPNSFTFNPPSATVRDAELQFIYEDREFQPEQLRQRLDSEIAEIAKWLTWSREMADAHNERLRAEFQRAVTTRKERLLANRSMASAIGYKIRRRGDATTVSVPAKRRTLRTEPKRPQTVRSGYEPEPALAEADYEEVIRIITASGRQLERVPATAAKLGEEERRDMMLVSLNTQFEGEAGGEMFNGSGKTDILVRVRDRNIFIGECKIWRGQGSFCDAIDQLLSYVVWRDTKAALILFIPNADATAVIDKAHEALAAHDRCIRAIDSSDPVSRRDYVFMGDRDMAREVHLALLPFVIPANGETSRQ